MRVRTSDDLITRDNPSAAGGCTGLTRRAAESKFTIPQGKEKVYSICVVLCMPHERTAPNGGAAVCYGGGVQREKIYPSSVEYCRSHNTAISPRPVLIDLPAISSALFAFASSNTLSILPDQVGSSHEVTL